MFGEVLLQALLVAPWCRPHGENELVDKTQARVLEATLV